MTDFAVREAERRAALHSEAGNYRAPVGNISGVEADRRGLLGEEAFAELFGVPIRCVDGAGGDGGWDFELSLRVEFKVDVKTAAKPVWLITQEGKTNPLTIYVLAHYLEAEDRAELLGWQWGSELLKTVPRMVGPRSCHWWPREKLRPMQELLQRRSS